MAVAVVMEAVTEVDTMAVATTVAGTSAATMAVVMVAGTSAVTVLVALILVVGVMALRASHRIRSGMAAGTSAGSGTRRCAPQLSAMP
jgi:hypothetical protein